LVSIAFQEQLTLNQITQQIQIEYEAENNRFVNEQVQEFRQFLLEVGIQPIGEMIYHLITLLEETYGPLQYQ
jgi:hypothetical protein